MALTKYKLGELIEPSDKRNENLAYGINEVKGISIQKVFIETKADMDGVSLRPYYLVKPGYFAYVTVTSRNGEKITIAHNISSDTYIVSSSYVVFHISRPEILDEDYLFMYFNRPEFDRYARFNSWGSARETFDWSDMCDIDIELPSPEIQKKYVDIYNSMLENQRCYERGLEDLKLTCFAMADHFKHTRRKETVGNLLEEVDVRNTGGICNSAHGINITKQFMLSSASSSDLLRYKLVYKNQFAYSAMQTGRDECIRIALYSGDEPIAVSPAYSVLQRKTDEILEEYIQLWFSRPESDRLGWFMSDASIRANLDLPRFYEIEIPVPEPEEQRALVNIYNAYVRRREINEQLKAQLRDICPILIRGSIEAGARNHVVF